MATELLGFEIGATSAWLVWILPFAAALIIPGIAKLSKYSTGHLSKHATGYIAIGFALMSTLSAASLIPIALEAGEIHHQIPWIESLGLKAGILADPLSIIMSNVVGWISFLILIYSTGYMKGDKDITRFWFWMMFFIGSMQLIVMSDNLLQLFFGWEGVGLASYALISFWYRDKKKDHVGTEGRTVLGMLDYYSPTHAGMKAFIMTKVGDVMMIAGMLLIFVYAGTFGLKELVGDTEWAVTMASQGLLVPAFVLLFGGAVGKSAQFPLNEWLLEAMTGPTSVSALIHAATMVKAGVFLVARLGPLVFALGAAGILANQFFEIIAWIGAITAILLATQAMVNPEIKKVLAYSTGSQIGYMMMALGVAGLSYQYVDGYTAGFFHLISHAMFKASLFMAAGAILHTVGSRFMTDMGGLRKKMKKTYAFMWAAGLGLMGAPFITTGFWSKDAIFAAVYESGNEWAMPLFAIAVFTAAITSFYTVRMMGLVFFGKTSKHIEKMEEEGHHIHEAPLSMWIPYGILAVLTIGVGLVGLSAEGGLHGLFVDFLENSYGIHTEHLIIESSILPEFLQGLNPVALGSSLAAFAIGAGLGYIFYIGRWVDPVKFVNSNIFFYAIHKFFLNRWYLNAIIYWCFVVAPLWLSRGVFRYFEKTAIDYGMNDGFQKAVGWSAKVVQGTQTGVAQSYLFVFGAGLLFVVLILLI
ncbi:NADH-quinone oxidoreductase subunit L [Marine Group I thaumarchaeote]|uniref:NADH-quinone oxidoreductase subunit L n=1 Tax=Marine Group I thaumarchaeote TaxID=2511932 RepID=A0A7K4N5A1_9ARCH|nr:MAG: NADH-quinone oxidoreductase subunit L [Nitrosopumilus sp. YT1]NMI81825.1 NADH-quinone oxidoreductase subunit L [Candidatus Nitrosopumilus sp. MTA1]NWJ19764.1 NADH-quinone oxidoreductase subunit L [Marine Group I thaumarchaeote]NWJ28159.1 NADH-quinone oxidoreductase subunit L [Marine Group I thaumarchaeote]NWJ56668.1 NADH-quinone oxidoreductase subunit L [Marine Group I thaumarchaeote]